MRKLLLLLTSALMMLSFLHCKGTENTGKKDDDNSFTLPKRGIVWKGEPLKLAPKGCYARIIQDGENKWLAAFEDGQGNVAVCKSTDGRSWKASRVVIPGFTQNSVWVNVANAEICRLKDGTLLCAGNYRPNTEGKVPFSIALSRSTDDGSTWSTPQILYSAGTYFRDGCWEPSFLELPDGTVHIYFADEGPYTSSSEQQITFISSSDKGVSWSEPAMVCFRAGRRDGMPVAAIFGDEIVVAIEDNGNGSFKPFTVRTSLDNPWAEPVLANSPSRDYALVDQLPSACYAGAPYLIKLPNGESLLSYQIADDGKLESAVMEVALGDSEARAFTMRTKPFGNVHALWNSIAVWDDYTVVAVATASLDGMADAPWIRFGEILH